MNSYWKDTLMYINTKDDFKGVNFYNWFSPLNVKDEVYGYSSYTTGTINTYFRVLILLGYIYRVDFGKYIKIRDIPMNLSFSEAKKFAYSLEPKQIDRYLKIKMVKEKMIR